MDLYYYYYYYQISVPLARLFRMLAWAMTLHIEGSLLRQQISYPPPTQNMPRVMLASASWVKTTFQHMERPNMELSVVLECVEELPLFQGRLLQWRALPRMCGSNCFLWHNVPFTKILMHFSLIPGHSIIKRCAFVPQEYNHGMLQPMQIQSDYNHGTQQALSVRKNIWIVYFTLS